MGVFTFPIIAPDLAENMRLSQSQLSTIVLAGIIGQYPFAALAGELVDRIGTWACSACASALFAIGYGLFTFTIEKEIPPDAHISKAGFRILVAAYGLLGIGAVFSYFSAVFSAVKQFPRHNGLAMGTSMALVGLSPLFLSLPSYLCAGPHGYVDAKAYVLLIGTLTTAVTFFSTLGLRHVQRSPPAVDSVGQPQTQAPQPADEETPLIPKPPVEQERPGYPQTWLVVVHDRHFWWLFVAMGVILGTVSDPVSFSKRQSPY